MPRISSSTGLASFVVSLLIFVSGLQAFEVVPQSRIEPASPSPVAPIVAPNVAVQVNEKDPGEVESVPMEEAPSSEVLDSDGATDEPPSDAQRIAELQSVLEEDQSQLKRLEEELESPDSEYAKSEAAFRELNHELEQLTEQLHKSADSLDAESKGRLESKIASTQRQRDLAEGRFDLAIEDRKTMREERATLKAKIRKDRAALAQLTGENIDEEDDAEADSSADERSRKTHADTSDNASNLESREEAEGAQRHTHSREHDRRSNEDADDKDISDRNPRDDSSDEEKLDESDSELMEAAAEAEEKEEEAEKALEETKSIASRMADLQKLVAQEQKELTLAKKRVDLVTAEQIALAAELSKRQAEQATTEELNDLRSSLSEANQRLIAAKSEVSEVSERLNERRAELSDVQAEHIVAMHEAESKRQEALAAENRVEALRNPFTFRNMLQWILEHGPRILVILISMFVLNRIAMFFATRSVQLVATGSGRGSTAERENRAKTLVGVFQNAATVAIFITGILMVLEEAGANITVLMGGVAVVGLAVAFGAQNLIKDYFYGFVMLLENQYMLNDSVRIGNVSGQVERITLRMTVLRDANGIVHFIPNGTINSVSNETHGWSRAVCEIAVGYHEDIDLITSEIKSIGVTLQSDPIIGLLLLEPPIEPSIESLGESSIVIKAAVKTAPNKHGAVKQEWLKRIRRRFVELGIEPPYPQRRIHLDHSSDASVQNDRAMHNPNRFAA